MARRQVLLVGQDAGVEADYDADVLAETRVPLGGELWSGAGGTESGGSGSHPAWDLFQ